MVDLASRITSLTTAIIILFQFVFSMIRKGGIGNDMMKRYIKGTTMLRERPGLWNITYSARWVGFANRNLIPSMCEKALKYKDA